MPIFIKNNKRRRGRIIATRLERGIKREKIFGGEISILKKLTTVTLRTPNVNPPVKPTSSSKKNNLTLMKALKRGILNAFNIVPQIKLTNL
jgi:hypothetical protein